MLQEETKRICLGDGPIPCKYMFIGEAPGRTEEVTGRPFMGKAGKVLNALLSEVGLSREKIFITNVVQYHIPGNRTPRRNEVIECRPLLLQEIKKVDPEYIILLGSTATRGIFPSKDLSISMMRGKIHTIGSKGRKFLFTYHPAATLYDKSFVQYILDDLYLLTDKKGEEARVEDKVDYKQVVRPQFSFPNREFAFDTETTGLDMYDGNGKILCLAITPEKNKSRASRSIDNFRELFNTEELLKIGHNLKFDMKWLMSRGIPIVGPIFDTLIAYHLLDENAPNKNLAYLAKAYTNLGEADVYEKYSPQYCGQHSAQTYQLYLALRPQLKKQGLMKLMGMQMMALMAFTRMELNGAKVSKEAHRHWGSLYRKKRDRLQRELEEEIGSINVNSSKQLGEYLYGVQGYPIHKTTDTGAPSTDKKTLKRLSKRAPEVKKILELRGIIKTYGLFFEGIEKLVDKNWFAHPHINLAKTPKGGDDDDDPEEGGGTVTGRPSYAKPNLQQVKREGKVKKIYVSRFPGGSIGVIDYSQIELRLLADYSGEPNLLEDFRSGRDIHTAGATRIFGIPHQKVTRQERKFAKKTNFRILYGGGPPGLAEDLEIGIDEAREFLRQWYLNYPGIKPWKKKIFQELARDKEVISATGRRRRLPNIAGDKQQAREAERQAVNAIIQGFASDMTVMALIQIDAFLLRGKYRSLPIISVHDSVILDLYPGEEKKVLAAALVCFEKGVPEILERSFNYKLTVPIKADVSSGKSWSIDDQKKWKKEVI